MQRSLTNPCLNTKLLSEWGAIERPDRFQQVFVHPAAPDHVLAYTYLNATFDDLTSSLFQPPHKHEKWQEPRNATVYGAACFQERERFLPFNISEDCLFANVYTPNVSRDETSQKNEMQKKEKDLWLYNIYFLSRRLSLRNCYPCWSTFTAGHFNSAPVTGSWRTILWIHHRS